MATLKGKCIFISRELGKAQDFILPLENKGATVYPLPLIRFVRWDRDKNHIILDNLSRFDWIVFTSANGVKYFFETIEAHQTSNSSLSSTRFAVVGTKTEAMLFEYGYKASFVPETFDANHFSKDFIKKMPLTNVLVVKGNLSRDVIDQALEEESIDYTNIFVYQTLTNEEVKDPLINYVNQRLIDGYVFTSPSSLNAFEELLGEIPLDVLETPCFCIGETTQAKAIEIGFNQTYFPKNFTLEGLSQFVINYYSGKES
ncbi:uroporphyrinogen-III synthase [Filobacillus milosensis]|uniref:Uroporphyrinogen-III synthase n=1 Tax=Filobacillus milosensis TaxID=94137 RepID=A0A4Y8IX06_9BACI|nr:uroporphyrinogen-III synthase [Filobacillus milosensis]TFB24945.1 uroporphyrinogen-III synthase [Filobacillus milosensis]